MDKIIIKSLEIQTTIGVTEEERNNPQKLYVDVQIEKELWHAGQSDTIEDTIDYATVAVHIKDIAARTHKLIETLAENIATDLLKNFPTKSVTIKVKKPSGVPEALYTAVEITRNA
ncbi:MAG: dihydroneopterin aldolase [Candidatus Woesearchaeota archaeon]|nr:dihydroneopterin aldolase [Candidatus Woesearchaeota archaeon]